MLTNHKNESKIIENEHKALNFNNYWVNKTIFVRHLKINFYF